MWSFRSVNQRPIYRVLLVLSISVGILFALAIIAVQITPQAAAAADDSNHEWETTCLQCTDYMLASSIQLNSQNEPYLLLTGDYLSFGKMTDDGPELEKVVDEWAHGGTFRFTQNDQARILYYASSETPYRYDARVIAETADGWVPIDVSELGTFRWGLDANDDLYFYHVTEADGPTYYTTIALDGTRTSEVIHSDNIFRTDPDIDRKITTDLDNNLHLIELDEHTVTKQSWISGTWQTISYTIPNTTTRHYEIDLYRVGVAVDGSLHLVYSNVVRNTAYGYSYGVEFLSFDHAILTPDKTTIHRLYTDDDWNPNDEVTSARLHLNKRGDTLIHYVLYDRPNNPYVADGNYNFHWRAFRSADGAFHTGEVDSEPTYGRFTASVGPDGHWYALYHRGDIYDNWPRDIYYASSNGKDQSIGPITHSASLAILNKNTATPLVRFYEWKAVGGIYQYWYLVYENPYWRRLNTLYQYTSPSQRIFHDNLGRLHRINWSPLNPELGLRDVATYTWELPDASSTQSVYHHVEQANIQKDARGGVHLTLALGNPPQYLYRYNDQGVLLGEHTLPWFPDSLTSIGTQPHFFKFSDGTLHYYNLQDQVSTQLDQQDLTDGDYCCITAVDAQAGQVHVLTQVGFQYRLHSFDGTHWQHIVPSHTLTEFEQLTALPNGDAVLAFSDSSTQQFSVHYWDQATWQLLSLPESASGLFRLVTNTNSEIALVDYDDETQALVAHHWRDNQWVAQTLTSQTIPSGTLSAESTHIIYDRHSNFHITYASRPHALTYIHTSPEHSQTERFERVESHHMHIDPANTVLNLFYISRGDAYHSQRQLIDTPYTLFLPAIEYTPRWQTKLGD